MKAKDKAKELLEKFKGGITYFGYNKDYEEDVVECAKIAVDEVIEAGNNIISELIDGYEDLEFNNYWQEVKNELNNMFKNSLQYKNNC